MIFVTLVSPWTHLATTVIATATMWFMAGEVVVDVPIQ